MKGRRRPTDGIIEEKLRQGADIELQLSEMGDARWSEN
jgi:hypothetical protein